MIRSVPSESLPIGISRSSTYTLSSRSRRLTRRQERGRHARTHNRAPHEPGPANRLAGACAHWQDGGRHRPCLAFDREQCSDERRRRQRRFAARRARRGAAVRYGRLRRRGGGSSRARLFTHQGAHARSDHRVHGDGRGAVVSAALDVDARSRNVEHPRADARRAPFGPALGPRHREARPAVAEPGRRTADELIVSPWPFAVIAVVAAYTALVTALLALQNRSPQSTFAWVLLFLLCPPGGLATYVCFGRGRRPFSRHQEITKLLEHSALAGRAARVVAAQPAAIEALARTQGEWARLASMLWASGRAPLTIGNHVEILQNASEKYPKLVDDIRAAARSVHLLYYEWASDPFTEQVADVLRDKVRAGVEVRILFDPVGSYFMLSTQYVDGLRRDGIQMQPFSSVYELHTISYRSHRKIAIIDGRVGYSGGLNMTEKHLTGPKGFTGWRDTHARITGEAVTILQSVFATMWANATGENLFDERYFPEARADGAGVPVQVVSAGPDSRWETIRQAYLTAIALARHHVYLQSPFLVLDTSIAEAMTTAALAGGDGRVMIAPAGGGGSPAYPPGMK